ncbi:hypothetical protein HY837_01380 [archaeon]|nr:hypothetical protein [archaeon]
MARPGYVRYAQNKAKVCGGNYEDYVKEYNEKNKRLDEIITEKDLTRPEKERKYLDNYKTLKECKLLSKIPSGAYAYGLADPLSFYSTVSIANEEAREGNSEPKSFCRQILNLNEKEFDDLYERVKNFLGQEYVSIAEELHKYKSMCDDNPDYIA